MEQLLKYPGGKWRISDWIVSHFPKHKVYLEPFFGSGAVLFNKPPSAIETVNDIDGDITNFFKVLREQPEKLLLPQLTVKQGKCWVPLILQTELARLCAMQSR